MAALFTWATNAFGAVASTVVSPFVAETASPVVQQASSKRPANKNKSTRKKKSHPKRAAGKRDSADASENEDVATAEPTSAETFAPPQADTQAPEQQEGDSSSGEEEVGKDESGTSAAAATAEAIRREKSRRKSQKAKEKQKQKKAMLANSIVKSLPSDPLQAERIEILSGLQSALREMATLEGKKFAEAQMMFAELQKSLDDLAVSVETSMRDMGRKTPKTEGQHLSSATLKDLIQKMEVSAERDEAALLKRVEELQHIISVENQREWVTAMNSFRDEISDRKKQLSKSLDAARAREAGEKALNRVRLVLETTGKEKEAESLSFEDLTRENLELTTELQSALYAPFHLARKIERRFLVAIENAPRISNSSNRNNNEDRPRNNNSRSVVIWGVDDGPESCIEFLQSGDFSAHQRRTYEKRLMGAIVGRSGSGLHALEAQSGAFIQVDGVSDVIVFGTRDQAEIVWAEIENLKINQPEMQVGSDFPIEPFIGRAIQALHRAKLTALEQQTKSRIIIISNPTDGTHPRVVVRCKPEHLDETVATVKKEIIDAYTLLTFDCPARAFSRLVIPKANTTSENSQLRLMHDEFKLLQETLSLFVDRINKPLPNTAYNPEADAGLLIVCNQMDAENVQKRIADLIERASYVTSRILIQREQMRIFTPENRGLIESSSGCRVSLQSTPGEATYVSLLGSSEAIEVGKSVVAEILAREGKVVSHPLKETEVMGMLLRDKAAMLRALETEHNVSISIDREFKLCKLVGDDTAIANCIKSLDDLCEERAKHRASMEKVAIQIDTDRIALLIGRAGNTINDIRTTSGVENIDIPRNRDEGAETTIVTVTGTKASVAVAQRMIERLLNINPGGAVSDERPAGAGARTRGRGRQLRGAEGNQRAGPPRTAGGGMMTQPQNLDEDSFPTIEAGMSVRAAPKVVAKFEDVVDEGAGSDSEAELFG